MRVGERGADRGDGRGFVHLAQAGAEHGASVEEVDALDLGVERLFEPEVAAGAERLPRVGVARLLGIEAGADLGVDLADDGFEEALLAAEVVVERAARHPGLGAERVHRRGGVAFGAEGGAGGGDEFRGGAGGHLSARAALGGFGH
jgi:hypothetical protein